MDKGREALLSGKVEMVDADLTSYFDMIPHRELLRPVAKRVRDGGMLRRIKAWLRAPLWKRATSAGYRPRCSLFYTQI